MSKGGPGPRAGVPSEGTRLGPHSGSQRDPRLGQLLLGTSLCVSTGRTLAEAASSRGFAKLERGSSFQPRTW